MPSKRRRTAPPKEERGILQHLPQTLLAIVLGALPVRTATSARQACRAWRCAKADYRNVTCSIDRRTVNGFMDLCIPSAVRKMTQACLSDTESAHLRRLSNLHHLEMALPPITSVALGHLLQLPIHTLELVNARYLKDADFLTIATLPLRKLNIAMADVTDTAFFNLAGLAATLEHLDACSVPITDFGTTALTALPSLKFLRLAMCSQITDAGLGVLANLSATRMDLSHLSLPTSVGFASLGAINNGSFNLSFCPNFDRNSLAGICANGTLKTLNLRANYKLSSADLTCLPQSVRFLNLEACSFVDDSVLAFFGTLNLETLNLKRCNITDLGLIYLIALALKKLNVSCCEQVTDAGLDKLASISSLNYLNLSQCPIGDAGLKHLEVLPHLAVLDVCQCPGVTGPQLLRFEYLQEISVWNCRNVDDHSLLMLEQRGVRVRQ